jgi:aldehyde dehydrogenase (NAD+)
LEKLINKAKIVIGGDFDVSDRYISPTVMFDVLPEDTVMDEEIFGPILPFVTINSIDDAVRFINHR